MDILQPLKYQIISPFLPTLTGTAAPSDLDPMQGIFFATKI